LARFSVSIDEDLVAAFDKDTKHRGYTSRSEAIRDAIRARLVEREWEAGDEVTGVITLLYDHHHPGLAEDLTDSQHHALGLVISTTHVHLDESNCLECIAVKGDARRIAELADRLTSRKGVTHGGLTATSTCRSLS